MLQDRLHKIIGISTDHAFCLHSKERVPYHIIVKVAFTGKVYKEDTPRQMSMYEASTESPLGTEAIELQDLKSRRETIDNFIATPR